MASSGTALLLFSISYHGLCCDAQGYYEGAEKILENGLFNFSDELRTFGYPLFLAFTFQLARLFSFDIKIVTFTTQWFVLLGAGFFAFRFFYSVFRNWEFAFLIFVGTMLNVFLLAYVSQILADFLSAVVILITVLLAVSVPGIRSVNHRITSWVATTAFLSFLGAGIATMIRPANLSIVGAITFIWIIRAFAFRDVTWRIAAFILLGLGLPFIPQVINNYRAWQVFQPLIVQNLYGAQLQWGLSYLKYGTFLASNNSPQLFYLNPFFCGNTTSPIEFALNEPSNFLLTTGLHLFGLFDFDFLFPYITVADPWYRVPLSILNYTFLFLTGIGIVRWVRHAIAKPRFNRIRLVFLGMLIAAVAYLVPYLFTAVENRFSLPIYLLIMPFFAYGVGWVNHLNANTQRIEIVVTGLALWGMVTVSILLSIWMSLQSPSLSGEEPTRCCTPLEKGLNLQMNQVQILGYTLDMARVPAGQDQMDLIVGWHLPELQVDTIQSEIQISDKKGHVWVRAGNLRYLSCTLSPWHSKPGTGAQFIFWLPPTMPPGIYQLTLNISDTLGNEIAPNLLIATVPIEKNKTSFTASQLYIEQPLFVDMREMRFLGYTSLPESIRLGETLQIGTYWRAREKPRGDYSVTVRMYDQTGLTALEYTSKPAHGTYPTIQWDAGEVLLDWYDLTLPEHLEPGPYIIEISLVEEINRAVLGRVSLPSILVTK